jgi:hypothetical protein
MQTFVAYWYGFVGGRSVLKVPACRFDNTGLYRDSQEKQGFLAVEASRGGISDSFNAEISHPVTI